MRRHLIRHLTSTCTPAERDAIAWAVRSHHARRTRMARAIARGEQALPGPAFWLAEVERQETEMRASQPMYARFRAFARTLTPHVIRDAADLAAMEHLDARLRSARYATGFGQLHTVWTRAELGVLITEATNRARQLAAGDPQREKGPALDPRRLPDERLDLLIQRHRDMAVVEALRQERARRAQADDLRAAA